MERPAAHASLPWATLIYGNKSPSAVWDITSTPAPGSIYYGFLPALLDAESPIEPFGEWLRQAVMDVGKLRFSDPAFADVTLDDQGLLKQPENRPLLRNYGDKLFVS